jgi:8-oxo-dGTP pyrophosphatase MutT (NUDIX family)
MLGLLKATVAARFPVDLRELVARRWFLDALDRLPAPFDQHAGPWHVTGSAVVVGPRGVLLHKHKRLGLWLQPGGHLELDESPLEAALREAHEETGLAMTLAGGALLHVDVHDGGRGHTHLDARYLLHADGDPAPPPGESAEVRWFSWPDAIAVADPGLRGLLQSLAPSQPLSPR